MSKFSWGKLEKVRSLKVERSVVGSCEGAQEGHQGGFSGTRTTTDRDKFARLDFEGNLVDGRDGTSPGGIDPTEIAGGKDHAHSLFSRRSW
jgi:hypothetical protein